MHLEDLRSIWSPIRFWPTDYKLLVTAAGPSISGKQSSLTQQQHKYMQIQPRGPFASVHSKLEYRDLEYPLIIKIIFPPILNPILNISFYSLSSMGTDQYPSCLQNSVNFVYWRLGHCLPINWHRHFSHNPSRKENSQWILTVAS